MGDLIEPVGDARQQRTEMAAGLLTTLEAEAMRIGQRRRPGNVEAPG